MLIAVEHENGIVYTVTFYNLQIRSADGNSASNVFTIVGATTSAGVVLIAASIVLWAVEKRCAKLKSSRRRQQSVVASAATGSAGDDATRGALPDIDGQRTAQPTVAGCVTAEIQLTSQLDEQQTTDDGQRTIRQPCRLVHPTEEGITVYRPISKC